jgi:hypothetical protein
MSSARFTWCRAIPSRGARAPELPQTRYSQAAWALMAARMAG